MLAMFNNVRQWSLSGLLDYFIPQEMQVDPVSHRRARMFMLSHVFGPILGNSLPAYLYVMNIARDYRVTVFFFSILAFWIYPFVLRWTGRYQALAFLSVQNLIFCALWACYAFGGLSSPFIPWILIFPLLAFLYLPTTGWVRNVLLIQIFGSVTVFMAFLLSGHEIPYINMDDMQVIGMVSMASVAIYFAMMSLYFARMYLDQRNFARELNSLISTSDNVRNLTTSAKQASAAKANFVASMSHELRTPLNAIIGYSHLLIEEAMDENDQESLTDLKKVHQSGSDLLRLIDDILDYSRIDAGKMPLNPTFDTPRNHIHSFRQLTASAASAAGYKIQFVETAALDRTLKTDWKSLGQALRHLCAAIASQQLGGTIRITFFEGASGPIGINITDLDEAGNPRPELVLHESFEHQDDASSSKYGGTGIELALGLKFSQLIGGGIVQSDDCCGVGNCLTIPDMDQPALAKAA